MEKTNHIKTKLLKKDSIIELCQSLLHKKIAINMDELKKGKYISRSQAIAVSYSQIKNTYPECSVALKKRNN